MHDDKTASDYNLEVRRTTHMPFPSISGRHTVSFTTFAPLQGGSTLHLVLALRGGL